MTRLNRLGVHGLVWTGTWHHEAVRAACQATAAAGYDLLEVPLLDPSEIDATATRSALDDAGLGATCSLGLDFATDISSTEPATVAAGAALLHSALEVAVTVGADHLCGPIYGAMAKYTSRPTARGRANSVAVLRELATEAEPHGITLGLEPVNRYESNLLNTIDQALAFADEVDRENVAVHVDSYHGNIEESDMPAAIRRAASAGRLGYVHVGESHRGYLGTGSIDWDGFFGAIIDTGYDGPIVFESFSSTVVSERFAAALAIWRDLWQDSADLAAHAIGFITDRLDASAEVTR